MFDISHLHPMVVHFPIALIMVGFLADISSFLFRKEKCLTTLGFYLELLGALAALVAFGTGYFLTGDTLENAGQTGSRHELFATLTLITILAASLLRLVVNYQKKEQTRIRYLLLGLFLLAFIFVGITGYYGGLIVYGEV